LKGGSLIKEHSIEQKNLLPDFHRSGQLDRLILISCQKQYS